MCGIAGIIDQGRSPEVLSGIMDGMLRIQHHRGPDATGKWSDDYLFFGHNRLSIIDLSEAANQPFHFGEFSIVFNGEVYNYVEIREDLRRLGHQFLTQSDTEVILHAYKEWGDACVERFVGMWSFAVWDSNRKRLFASRDRFGIKPFYYINAGNSLYFASEIKTLKASPVFTNSINLRQVARGLQMGWLGYFDETYFEVVKSLPAAHNLVWEKDRTTVSSYWDIETAATVSGSFDEKCHRFEQLFRESVRIHLRSDVPVASCLSGGLDSSAIVSMVQDLHPGHPYKTFSIYYDGSGDVDERPFIREVIRKYPAVTPQYFMPDDDEVREQFSRALYHADAPATGSSFISQYFLMKLIRENGIKVVLDGQGADEYLGGYMHSYYRLIASLIRSGRIGKAASIEKALNAKLGHSISASVSHAAKSMMALLLSEQSLYAVEYKKYYPFLTTINPEQVPFNLRSVKGSRLSAFLYHLIFSTSLPSLLQYEDRNSMAFSVESRVPFLDHRLVEFAFGLADEDKIHGLSTKHILRESLKDILPEPVYSRTDKKGFVTPGENKWLRGPLSGLLDQKPVDLPFLRKRVADEVLRDYRSGNNSRSTLVWRIAVLGEWMKHV